MSKLVAGREEDRAFIAAQEVVREGLAQTSLPESRRALAADRLHRIAIGGGK